MYLSLSQDSVDFFPFKITNRVFDYTVYIMWEVLWPRAGSIPALLLIDHMTSAYFVNLSGSLFLLCEKGS